MSEVVHFTVEDELEVEPERRFTMRCPGGVRKSRLLSQLNSTKWRGPVGPSDLRSDVLPLRGCELLEYSERSSGRYTGGPLGRRKYIPPSTYEERVSEEVPEPELRLTCLQEGPYLRCAEESDGEGCLVFNWD
jgi:hypothetical protein